jgi:outer membrane protein TolC
MSLVTLSAGCVNWSGDVAKYRAVLDPAPPATRPAAFDPAEPLPLLRAMQLAELDNQAIASRGENYIQALADKMRQAGTLLPTLTLAPSYTLTHENSGGGAVVAGSGAQHQFSVPLDASVTGSLSSLSNIQAAGRTAQQQAQLLLDERETILLQVVQSYYAVLKAERQSDVYEHSVKLKAEKVRDQDARLKLGAVRPLDLAQSEADLAGTRASLVQSHTDGGAFGERAAHRCLRPAGRYHVS